MDIKAMVTFAALYCFLLGVVLTLSAGFIVGVAYAIKVLVL